MVQSLMAMQTAAPPTARTDLFLSQDPRHSLCLGLWGGNDGCGRHPIIPKPRLEAHRVLMRKRIAVSAGDPLEVLSLFPASCPARPARPTAAAYWLAACR